MFITFAICATLTVHTQHSFDHVLNPLRKGSGLGVSQARPQGTGMVCGGSVLLLGAASISIVLAVHSLLVIVEACIGLTDLQQQAWMGRRHYGWGQGKSG